MITCTIRAVLSCILISMVLMGFSIKSQAGTISGYIIDGESDQSLPGATVMLEELGLGTAADADGYFEFTDVPEGTYTLHVNFVGFYEETQEVEVTEGEEVSVNINLFPDLVGLDELVVTGAAIGARQREMGSSIASINTAEISEPVRNIDELLAGRTSGMTVNPGSGTMGAGAAIRLRGNVSMSQSNQPLIYIDGVRQGADSYPLNRSDGADFWQSPQSTASPLNDISPNDIERIEIIRGASATTLYGSEAAAGVIQIFTKRGQEGAPRWTFNTTQRIQSVQEFGGSDVRPYLGMEPYLKNAYGQEYSLSVSGGQQGVEYYLSGLFDDGEGVHPNDHERRYALRANLSVDLLDNLSVDLNTSYNNHDMTITHVGNNLYGLQFNVFRQPAGPVGSDDPEVIYQLLDAKVYQNNIRFNTGLTLRYNPSANFSNRVVLGLDRTESDQMHDTPFGYILKSEGSISQQNWTNQAYSFEYVGTYTLQLSDNFQTRFNWGGQNITTQENMLDGYGEGLPGPGEHTLSSTASRLVNSSGARTVDAGIFGETTFNYLDRYYLTAGLRVDGNSTFGEDMGYQPYPKVSASYVISEEDFFPDETLGHLRLRAGFGMAGTAPGPFDAVRTWNPRSFEGQSAFLPANVGNPDLGPERSQELEAGFESSILDNMVNIEFTYYYQETRDALFNVTQVPSRGFTGSQLDNIGSLKNEGIELEVDVDVLRTEQFSWFVGGSLSTNNSEILDTGGETFFSFVEGHPAPVQRGTKVTNADEYADPEFETDAFFGPMMPTHSIGFGTGIIIPYGISLDATLEYQGGHFITQDAQWNNVDRGSGASACDDVYALVPHGEYSDDHPNLGQINAHDRAHCYSENLESGLWVEPADNLKLRNVTLSIPIDTFMPGNLAGSLSFSASNIRLWTHEDFTSFDPEMIWSRAGLTALTTGIPETTPAPMRFTGSLRVTF